MDVNHVKSEKKFDGRTISIYSLVSGAIIDCCFCLYSLPSTQGLLRVYYELTKWPGAGWGPIPNSVQIANMCLILGPKKYDNTLAFSHSIHGVTRARVK